jgi:hypothetical protein
VGRGLKGKFKVYERSRKYF